MNINIICVGKIKQKYLIDAIDDYKKRLTKYANINIIEIKEEKVLIENDSNILLAKNEEGKRILKVLSNDYNIALAIEGEELSTIQLYNKIQNIKNTGYSNINFIIGASYGLSDEVKKKTNFKLSFSKMTFPHQLFRVILLEQIYRVMKIENNEPYHK